MELKKLEYRVRPVTRYVVTRYHEFDHGAGVDTKGEYDNPNVAYEVGYALCKAEHEQLGFPPGDERVQYPFLPSPDGRKTSMAAPTMPAVAA